MLFAQTKAAGAAALQISKNLQLSEMCPFSEYCWPPSSCTGSRCRFSLQGRKNLPACKVYDHCSTSLSISGSISHPRRHRRIFVQPRRCQNGFDIRRRLWRPLPGMGHFVGHRISMGQVAGTRHHGAAVRGFCLALCCWVDLGGRRRKRKAFCGGSHYQHVGGNGSCSCFCFARPKNLMPMPAEIGVLSKLSDQTS